jgi:3-deoxy-7-phosphoheptulonate synthase
VHRIEDLHVRALIPLTPPRILKEELPRSDAAGDTVYQGRETIKRILSRDDPRLLIVAGPCSIHDPEAATEYAGRLLELHRTYQDSLYIIMRTYFEKPRTTVGWRGLINDPRLDGSFDMETGLRAARDLLLQINDLGMPAATEMVDPITPQYISDLVSLTAIGARTSESQTHRAMASGLSMPVGYKNGTDGSVQVAVNAYVSATSAHSFLGVTGDGLSCVVKTTGNPDGFVILRGSHTSPNYDAESIANTEGLMRRAGLNPSVMIDCSHANSAYDDTRQEQVWNTVLAQHYEHNDAVIGMMIESNLFPGKQSLPADLTRLRYGVSITDACIDWETTVRMIDHAAEFVARFV